MTRPTASPEPFEESAWWGSSRSLDILAELEVVARVSARTVEVVVTPFTPPPMLPRDAAGRPVVLLPGDVFRVTSRRQLHAVAQEALRAATDGPPCKDAPLVCYRVVVDHRVAYVWSHTALGPVEQWLIETANCEARRLADQLERENLSAWLWELSQGRNPAPPPRDADRLATFRRASELVLTGAGPRRRPARRRPSPSA